MEKIKLKLEVLRSKLPSLPSLADAKQRLLSYKASIPTFKRPTVKVPDFMMTASTVLS